MDNGPQFISITLAQWAEEHGVELEFIKPDKPMQNSHVANGSTEHTTTKFSIRMCSKR
jgi:putative transposase